MIKIYHNPRCRKSREALEMLRNKNIEFQVIEYLKAPLNYREIADLLIRLDKKAEQLIRKNEKLFREQYKGLHFNEEEWIQVMVEHPQLIERPLIVNGPKAVIGRTPEEVLRVISS